MGMFILKCAQVSNKTDAFPQVQDVPVAAAAHVLALLASAPVNVRTIQNAYRRQPPLIPFC